MKWCSWLEEKHPILATILDVLITMIAGVIVCVIAWIIMMAIWHRFF